MAEGVSYGANTIRDGVSLTPRRELRSLALPSEIMRLENPHGYLKFPGPWPVASIKLDYVKRPKIAARYIPRAPEGHRKPCQSDEADTKERIGTEGAAAAPLPADPGARKVATRLLALLPGVPWKGGEYCVVRHQRETIGGSCGRSIADRGRLSHSENLVMA